MIIVSQDKKVVVNFERTNWVQVSKVDDKKSVIEINYADGDWKMIAEYKTEERAKEVLQEIIKVYKFYNGKTYYVEDEKKLLGKYEYGVYEMPIEKVDDK